MKSISILGSTGSIGCNTLKVVEHLQDEFRVVALGAGKNVSKLAEQIAQFNPELVSVEDEICAENLLKELHKLNVKPPKIALGESGLVEAATIDAAETVVSATVGAVGFVPTLRAIEAGKRIALANKETLVMAGQLMTEAARKSGAELLPVGASRSTRQQWPAKSQPGIKIILGKLSGFHPAIGSRNPVEGIGGVSREVGRIHLKMNKGNNLGTEQITELLSRPAKLHRLPHLKVHLLMLCRPPNLRPLVAEHRHHQYRRWLRYLSHYLIRRRTGLGQRHYMEWCPWRLSQR